MTMIDVRCPKCRVIMKEPQENHEQKIFCACGQKLSVPAKKTIMAEVIEKEARPSLMSRIMRNERVRLGGMAILRHWKLIMVSFLAPLCLFLAYRTGFLAGKKAMQDLQSPPSQTLPSAHSPVQSNVAGFWVGTEYKRGSPKPFKICLYKNGRCDLNGEGVSAGGGRWTHHDDEISISFNSLKYTGKLYGSTMSGMAKTSDSSTQSVDTLWLWEASKMP